MKQTITITYEKHTPESLPPKDVELVRAAVEASQRAFAPYSHFKVGAAARLSDGTIISAANCESEVFPSGMCAERSLLYHLRTTHAHSPIETIAIASDPATGECYPCGACRQVLLDAERAQQSPIRLIMAGPDSASIVASVEELLPFTFKL